MPARHRFERRLIPEFPDFSNGFIQELMRFCHANIQTNRLLLHPLTHLLTNLLTSFLTSLLIHSSTYSFTHLRTHLRTCLLLPLRISIPCEYPSCPNVQYGWESLPLSGLRAYDVSSLLYFFSLGVSQLLEWAECLEYPPLLGLHVYDVSSPNRAGLQGMGITK